MTDKNTVVVTNFGTLDEDQLRTLSDGIKEMSVVMEKISALKDQQKEILNRVYDEIKIPKKIINRMTKSYHKKNYTEVCTEDNEFQVLYETALGSKE